VESIKRVIIRFLCKEGVSAGEIHRQLDAGKDERDIAKLTPYSAETCDHWRDGEKIQYFLKEKRPLDTLDLVPKHCREDALRGCQLEYRIAEIQ
jgi:hypothetical protein